MIMWIWETAKDFIATLPWSPKWACRRLERNIRKKREKIKKKERENNVDK